MLPETEAAGVEVWVKRDDLLGLTTQNGLYSRAAWQGNKARKLKYNLRAMQEAGVRRVVTFGGAHSNHLRAVAALCAWAGIETVGIVRGEQPTHESSTLTFCREAGMELHFVTRAAYREKYTEASLTEWRARFGDDAYLLPEGGSNALAVLGCADLVDELPTDKPTDYLLTACGTGATAAGLLFGVHRHAFHAAHTQVVGVSVLKGGDFLRHDIEALLAPIIPHNLEERMAHFSLITDAHFGGYAKMPPELRTFCDDFGTRTPIPVEPVYTGKLFAALFRLLEAGYFTRGSRIVAVHTGGLFV